MVSNARLDLPEPESPVTTMRLSRGISSEMFLRLCTRAPCTAIVVRAVARGPAPFPLFADEARGAAFFRFPFVAALEAIPGLLRGKECQFLHVNITLLREAHGY